MCGAPADALARVLSLSTVADARAGQTRSSLAEGERFELSEPLDSPVFKTGAFDHSATPPAARILTCARHFTGFCRVRHFAIVTRVSRQDRSYCLKEDRRSRILPATLGDE